MKMEEYSKREKSLLLVVSVLLAIVGYLLTRKPTEVIKTVEVEVIRTEYKDRIVYKDRRIETRSPDGTIVVEESREGTKDSSGSSSSETNKEVQIARQTLPRYSVSYSVLSSQAFGPTPYLGLAEIGVRLGDLPAHLIGSYSTGHGDFGLGIRLEF